MKFTFGIITAGSNNNRESLADSEVGQRINRILDTIDSQNIPTTDYEVIIVGGSNHYTSRNNVKHIEFDENIKPKWITKKKNLITENSNFENIVFMHDYIELEDNWYSNFLKFGNDWDVCMNVVNNIEGGRWIDWLMRHPNGYHILMPYDHSNKLGMYISGAYWVAKKTFMEDFPLNESLGWGDAEDTEWSDRWILNPNFKYTMNTLSKVRCCKDNKTYSVLFLNKSMAEEAFKTDDVNKMKRWYTNPDGSCHLDDANIPPWCSEE